MTESSHQSGTDRVAEVAAGLDCEIVVNIQGDEAEIEPDAIDAVVNALERAPDAVMSTLAHRTSDRQRAADPNVVKVVTDRHDRALYFSRAPIPYLSSNNAKPSFLLPVGLYAYRREFLLEYARMSQTPLERAEKLEQLRAVENGYIIKVAETRHPAFSIDTLAEYEAFVARYSGEDQ